MNDTIGNAKRTLTITGLWPRLGLPETFTLGKKCRSPFREDRRPSFEVSVDPSDGFEKWKDWSTGEHGDALDFFAKARGLTIKEARPAFLALAGGDQTSNGHATSIYRCTEQIEGAAKLRGDRPLIHPGNFRVGTKAEFAALSRLRNISMEGLHLASAEGVLRFGKCQGFPCWTVLDGTYLLAQSRRLDGKLFDAGHKTQSWRNSQQSWPLNCYSLGTRDKVALVEGGPDMLAAFGYAYAERKQNSVAIIGMLGASCSIPADVLPLFSGKQVRIFPHVDEAGQRATDRWWEQLTSVGANLSRFDFNGLTQDSGQPVRDFNDLTSISCYDFERERVLWEVLP